MHRSQWFLTVKSTRNEEPTTNNMSVIIFCVHPIAGSVNASLKLAKQLKEIGHQIYYLGVPDCEDYISQHGFDFIAVFGNWFSKGWFADGDNGQSNNVIRDFLQERAGNKWIRDFMLSLSKGEDTEFLNIIEKIRANLIIVVATHYDSFIWALLSHKVGVKCIYLHDTLCQSVAYDIPPITTGIIPNKTITSCLKITLSWHYFFFKRFLYQALLHFGVNLYSKNLLKKVAKGFNYPIEDIDLNTDMLAPKLKLPELVLCPSEIEFPGSINPNRFYAEAAIDFERQEVSFPWGKINQQLPLVYCSLGSLRMMSVSQYRKFFQAVISVAAVYQDYQWVLATGASQDIGYLPNVPTNLVIVKKAPQIALLKKAVLMINHGGTNTIKECMILGVPMIAFPVGFDTYGNTARIIYQGLGVKGDINKINHRYLELLFRMVSTNQYYQIRCQMIKKVCVETENTLLALKFVQQILS